MNTKTLQNIIAPVLLGKNPSLIEFSSDGLVMQPSKESESPPSSRLMAPGKESPPENIAIEIPAGMKYESALFPSIGCHEHSIHDSIRRSVAHFIVDGGSITHLKKKAEAKTRYISIFTADSLGQLNNSTIYLSDKDGADLVTGISNLANPRNATITILLD